jgi:hypothetical protein
MIDRWRRVTAPVGNGNSVLVPGSKHKYGIPTWFAPPWLEQQPASEYSGLRPRLSSAPSLENWCMVQRGAAITEKYEEEVLKLALLQNDQQHIHKKKT